MFCFENYLSVGGCQSLIVCFVRSKKMTESNFSKEVISQPKMVIVIQKTVSMLKQTASVSTYLFKVQSSTCQYLIELEFKFKLVNLWAKV